MAHGSDRGQVRANNEDAFAIDVDAGVFIVCDGMGGAASGEIASRMTADGVLGAVREDPSIALATAIASANQKLFVAAREEIENHGMGTTIVALKLAGNTAAVANVGDSRCYRLRDSVLEQMTQDHSFVGEQVRRGLMSASEAALSSMKNVITRAVGTSEQLEVDAAEWEIRSDDLYLLASDGLTREVSDQGIAEILREHENLQAACGRLLNAANDAGGRDNATCILIRIASEESLPKFRGLTNHA